MGNLLRHRNFFSRPTEIPVGPSVNKEYLCQIQFYSIFGEHPVVSNTVVIITACVKVANSTFLVTSERTKWAELSRYCLGLCMLFYKVIFDY